MTYTPPTVAYSATIDGTYTTLTGVQSVNISRGRQRFQDPVGQSSCVIELIPANSYSLPLAIGQFIDVRSTAAVTNGYFCGRITDVQRNYGMPYTAGTGAAPADRITITATGGTGVVGASQLNGYSLANNYVNYSLDNLVSSLSVLLITNGYSWVRNSAQTVSGSALDAVNQLCRTAQIVLDDFDMKRTAVPGGQQFGVLNYPSGQKLAGSFAFADDGSAAAFRNIQFLSSVQNTFNWIELEATGVYTVIAAFGAAPFNALKYTTYSENPADASNLASYLWYLLSGQVQAAPYVIETDTTVSASCVDYALLANGWNLNTAIGQPVSVKFRGSTTYGIIESVQTSFGVDKASVRLFLSPSLGTPFTLDSSAFGALDQNRLGYP